MIWLAYSVGEPKLYYFALGLPVCFYLLYMSLSQYYKLEVNDEYMCINNLLFNKRIIYYKDIKEWKDIGFIRGIGPLLSLKLKGKKLNISIIGAFDMTNYEELRAILRINLHEKQSFK
jgi:hypothetical protein